MKSVLALSVCLLIAPRLAFSTTHDYDGNWKADITCVAGSQSINRSVLDIGPLNWSFTFAVNAGHFATKIPREYGSLSHIEDWSGTIQSRGITVRGIGSRTNGDSWNLNFSGSLSSLGHFSLVGNVLTFVLANDKNSSGWSMDIARCEMRLTSVNPTRPNVIAKTERSRATGTVPTQTSTPTKPSTYTASSMNEAGTKFSVTLTRVGNALSFQLNYTDCQKCTTVPKAGTFSCRPVDLGETDTFTTWCSIGRGAFLKFSGSLVRASIDPHCYLANGSRVSMDCTHASANFSFASTIAPGSPGQPIVKRATPPTPTVKSTPDNATSNKPITFAQTADQIAEMQRWLNTLGYYKGVTDGILGPATIDAIARWRLSQNMSPEGFVTIEERERMRAQAVIRNKQSPDDKTKAPPILATPATPSVPPGAFLKSDEPAFAKVRENYINEIGREPVDNLLLGDPRDLVFLFNETATAPNGVRGLSGNITFKSNRIAICRVLDSNSPLEFIDYVKREWLTKGKMLANYEYQETRCSLDFSKAGAPKIATFDLFMIERRWLLTPDQELTQGIVDLIRRKVLSVYSIAEWPPFEILQQTRRSEAAQNLRSLKDGSLAGFGMLVIPNNSNVFCGSEAEDRRVLIEVANQLNRSILEPSRRMVGDATLLQSSADDVFVSVKRNACGFVLGEAQFLGTINSALVRDGIESDLAPLWLSPAKFDELVKDVQSRAALAKTKLEKEQQQQRLASEQLERDREAARIKQEEQRRLEIARRARDEEARRQELERMRKLVASRAQAVMGVFDGRLRAHLSSVKRQLDELKSSPLHRPLTDEDRIKSDQQRSRERLPAGFSAFTKWQFERAKEEWEFGDTKTVLEDYGLAKWRSRMIEAIAVRVELPMINRIIGERKTECVMFAWINDEEFSMLRQHLVAPCSDFDQAFKDWSSKNEFKSQWKM